MDYDALILKIKLIVLLEAVSISLSTIASNTGMSQRTLEKWRNFKDISKPSQRTTKKVCAELGIEHYMLHKNKELYSYLKHISLTYQKSIEQLILFLKDATSDVKVECNNGKTINDIVDRLKEQFERENKICDNEQNVFNDSKAMILYIKERLNLDYENSFQLWKLLEDKVFFREYKVNFKRSIDVHKVDKDGYREIKIRTDYELKNSDRKNLIFSCSLEGVTTDVVNDENCEISWIFVPVDSDIKRLPDKCFSVDSVYIDNQKLKPRQNRTSDKRVEYIVEANLKSSHKIHYIFTVKQAAKYCFVSDYLTKITYNYTVELNIKDQNIKNVYPKEYLLLSGQHYDPNEKGSTEYIVYGDGWLLPRSGVSFSWSMK